MGGVGGEGKGGWEGGDERKVPEEGLSRVSDWQQGREREGGMEGGKGREGEGKGGWERGGNLE